MGSAETAQKFTTSCPLSQMGADCGRAVAAYLGAKTADGVVDLGISHHQAVPSEAKLGPAPGRTQLLRLTTVALRIP